MGQVEYEIAELLEQHRSYTGIPLAVGTVESATGGEIADRLTNISGISLFYKGSLISYHNTLKIGLAGVLEETMRQHGAVSRQTAAEMAAGGKKLLGLDICISDTGIAGPGGATLQKPVGLFYIGLSAFDNTVAQKYLFKGDRLQNKTAAADAALSLLKGYLAERNRKLRSSKFKSKHVVTCFIEHNGRVLIVKRSKKVGTYQGRWSAISGYLDADDALNQAFTEISEETDLGVSDIKLIARGKPLELIDEALSIKWTIHPFLFAALSPDKIKLDWENLEMKWISPSEFTDFYTVPGLESAYLQIER